MSLCRQLSHIWFKYSCFKCHEIIVSNNIDMKNLGETDAIIGIKITRIEKRISLYQSNYVEKILRK
jgi:hypothetical protein